MNKRLLIAVAAIAGASSLATGSAPAAEFPPGFRQARDVLTRLGIVERKAPRARKQRTKADAERAKAETGRTRGGSESARAKDDVAKAGTGSASADLPARAPRPESRPLRAGERVAAMAPEREAPKAGADRTAAAEPKSVTAPSPAPPLAPEPKPEVAAKAAEMPAAVPIPTPRELAMPAKPGAERKVAVPAEPRGDVRNRDQRNLQTAAIVPPQKDSDLLPKSPEAIPAEMPQEEKQCRAELKALGVKFRELKRLSDPAGCLVEWPLEVMSLGRDVELSPNATLNCETALSAAKFLDGDGDAAAREIMGSGIAGVGQASAYVCRVRNGTKTLSEHAYGNALDISAIKLDDGRTIDVQAYGPGNIAERDFLRRLRALACGPFRTVLGPGSDADHATHLHLDQRDRRASRTFCQ